MKFFRPASSRQLNIGLTIPRFYSDGRSLI
jgi:hypothetical protein